MHSITAVHLHVDKKAINQKFAVGWLRRKNNGPAMVKGLPNLILQYKDTVLDELGGWVLQYTVDPAEQSADSGAGVSLAAEHSVQEL